MKHNYAYNEKKENIAKVVGRDLNLSTKQSIEICNYIRKKELVKAKNQLEKVLKKELAIPFKRFTEGAGHKKRTGPGKYPLKASKQILMLLKSLEANAQNKGLSTNLKIIHVCAQQAAKPMRSGRRRTEMKRSHVEIVAEEIPKKKEKPKTTKPSEKK